MTTAADDRAVEEAFEASLAGRPVPGSAAGLAAFTGAVREAATQPGRPSAALAELLATGLLIDQSSPSTRTASTAASSSRVRIRRRFAMIFPVLIAKFLSAGAVAQAATGAGVVVVAVAGAGTVGVLPGPVQDTFTTLVGDERVVETPEDVTGEVPDEDPNLVDDGEPADPTEIPALPEDGLEDQEEVPDDDLESTERQLWVDAGPAEGESFGSWVARGAEEGWANGATVRKWAHLRNEERRRAHEAERAAEAERTAEERDAEASGADDAEETEAEETEAAGGDHAERRDEDRNRGNGRGDGQGNGRGNGRG
jgi:hypothetical protein